MYVSAFRLLDAAKVKHDLPSGLVDTRYALVLVLCLDFELTWRMFSFLCALFQLACVSLCVCMLSLGQFDHNYDKACLYSPSP